MIKRRISLVLVLAMLLSLMMPTLAFGAVDYSDHWAEDTIQDWFDNDKLKGYEDGSFRPDLQITRAEFMTMVNNAYEYTEKAEVSFTDVDSDDWFYEEVQKAVEAGYLLGYEDNTARPENRISRQEAALIIARIKELSNYASGANIFKDVEEIAAWAKGGVGAIAREKLMIGYEDGTFRPLRAISRAEALVTIDRAYEWEAEKETGGTSGRDTNKPAPKTTPTAITIDGVSVTSSAITVSAISATSTSAAITITPYVDGVEVTIESTYTTTGSAVTTTAITVDGSKFTIGEAYDRIVPIGISEATIEITVTESGKDTIYIINVIREED